jgi:hypothetical protein
VDTLNGSFAPRLRVVKTKPAPRFNEKVIAKFARMTKRRPPPGVGDRNGKFDGLNVVRRRRLDPRQFIV